MRKYAIVAMAAWLGLAGRAWGQTTRPAGLSVSDEEKAGLLAAESDAQKKLRAELADLAKRGDRVYYNSSCDGVQRIYSVAPDGSGLTCVTPRDWTDGATSPHFVPGGAKMVFQFGRKATRDECLKLPCDPRYKIADNRRNVPADGLDWVMNLDGSDLHPVAMGGWPRWSDDGRYLAYCSIIKPNRKYFGLLDVAKGTEWLFPYRAPGTTAFSADGQYYVLGAAMFKIDDITSGQPLPKPQLHGGAGCNQDCTLDGKWIVHVIDYRDGSWIVRLPYEPGKRHRMERLDLGLPRASQNYYPAVSGDCKYMAWSHWDNSSCGQGDQRYFTNAADIYVTHWPPDGVAVRITWHGGQTQRTCWWTPKQHLVGAAAPPPAAPAKP